jgi:acyl-CoA synthetase (AMP-forming)/AMP-acid ligase II
VVLKGATNPEALRSFCRERLADFEVPEVIRIVTQLPKNALGKVQRRALAALYRHTSNGNTSDRSSSTAGNLPAAAAAMNGDDGA